MGRKTMTIEMHLELEEMTDDELAVHTYRLVELLDLASEEKKKRDIIKAAESRGAEMRGAIGMRSYR